jgi:protein SCO1/2
VLVAQQIRGALDDLGRRVPVLFASVDERADTPARVQAFLRTVGLQGRVRYLVGPAAALRRTWSAYHVTTPAAGRAAFERAVPVLLIDPQGHERVLYEQEQLTPEVLANDIGVLSGRPVHP